MGVKARLVIMMMFLVILPLGVTGITWLGLGQMDTELRQVTEEFLEARRLQVVESDLGVAVAALAVSAGEGDDLALRHLREAEAGLIDFLASQHGSVAQDEHQADEAGHASELVKRLGVLTGTAWAHVPHEERFAESQAILSGLDRLFRDADAGVREVPALSQETRRRTLLLVITASLASAVTCVAVSAWSTRGVVIRLRELHAAMRSQSESPERRAPRDVDDVVSDIQSLNERLLVRMEEKNRELLRRERMAGIGLLAADVAHEISNPLNAMLGLSELSLRATGAGPVTEETREEIHESLGIILREIVRCRGIVQRLMAMVRGPGRPQHFDATRLLAETVEIAQAARPDRARCFVAIAEHRGVSVSASLEDVRQIILTLLINAADAVAPNGQIQADATRVGDEVWLRVHDNGRGFTAEAQACFDVPFSTTRSDDGGTGLGLSIAHAIARDIGAEIRSESGGPGKGSLFMLVLKASDEPPL